MIRLVREHGASAVLLNNELWGESPYRASVRKIAGDLGARSWTATPSCAMPGRASNVR